MFQFTFLLLVIFLLEAMVGILAYFYKDQVRLELELNLNNTFLENYEIDTGKTDAINQMQQKVCNKSYSNHKTTIFCLQFKCCGAVRFEDWEYSKWRILDLSGENLVPDSCCKTTMINCGKRDHPSNIYYSVRHLLIP